MNIGLAIASLVVSPVMSVVKTKHVLVLTQLANAAASLLFAVSSHYATLTLARFLLGFTQAFCFIYAPIWTNEFAPKTMGTRWMAFNQAFCAIGVITGYGVGALIVDGALENPYIKLDWRKGFALQAFALLFVSAGFASFDNNRLDIFGERMGEVPMNVEIKSVHSKFSTKTRKDVAAEKFGDVLPLTEFTELIKIKVFVYVTMSLCATYFSSTALQFWCTNYIITCLQVRPSNAHMIFGFSAITAPLIGAAVGGYVTDSFVSLTFTSVFFFC